MFLYAERNKSKLLGIQRGFVLNIAKHLFDFVLACFYIAVFDLLFGCSIKIRRGKLATCTWRAFYEAFAVQWRALHF